MRKISIVLIFGVLLAGTGCSKFLEEQSQSEIVPKTAKSLNELLLGEGYSMMPSRTLLMDDDITHQPNNMFTGRGQGFPDFSWQPKYHTAKKAAFGSNWATYYRFIQICNTVIDYSAKVTGTTEEKEFVKGQALLLRAYHYFNLVNLYAMPYTDPQSDPNSSAGVPIILQGGVSQDPVGRSTVAQVYGQIVKDLKEGITILQQLNKQDILGRINYLAGYLLQSRVHLHMGNWELAIESATKLLDSKGALVDLNAYMPPASVNMNPAIANQGVESLWEFGSAQMHFSGWSSGEYADFKISQSLIASFEPGDLRTTIYIKGNVFNKLVAPTNWAAKDVPGGAFRTAEAYLNRAEAYAHQFKAGNAGAAALALADLNTIRVNRISAANYQPLQTNSPDQLLQWCREEKRREFFREEHHRWFDLRRNGMPSFTHTYLRDGSVPETYRIKERDAAYVLEIPDEILQLNIKLTDNPVHEIKNPE